MSRIKPHPVEYTCPECGTTVMLPNRMALALIVRSGKCQGCRALDTFKRNPGIALTVVDFWERTDSFPKSNTWLQAPVFRYGGVQ